MLDTLFSWLRPQAAEVGISVNRTLLTTTELKEHVARSQAAERAQFNEVMAKVAALPSPPPGPLALEAILSRYVPQAAMPSNLRMMDSDAWWKRMPRLEEAQSHVAGLLGMAPGAEPAPPEVSVPDAAVDLLRGARVCWLLGAGISKAAGIPTYRGPDSNDDAQAQRLRSLDFYLRHSDVAWVYVNALKGFLLQKEPTAAHRAISALARGNNHSVITQNIDTLEQRAGLSTLHIHGRVTGYHCLKERKEKDARDPRYNNDSFPICPDCGALLKPGITLFGEGLNNRILDEATRCIAAAQVLVEVGTSHSVAPVSQFHRFARRRGVKVMVINSDPAATQQDADVHLTGDAQAILCALQQRLL
jgi:NAD-dependent deacetylase